MSVKAGKFITTGQGYLLSRLQSTGVSSINLPKEKIYETGNEESVATVRDIPSVGYEVESFEMSAGQEAILTNRDPGALSAGEVIRFTECVPQMIAAPFKAGGTQKNTVAGIAVPYLTVESASYRFGVGSSASQTFTFTGDSYYPAEDATPYFENQAGGDVLGEYDFANPALPTLEKGEAVYALGVTVIYADNTFKRLFHGDDFANDASGITLVDPDVAPAGSRVHLLYQSSTHDEFLQSVHPEPDVLPAALRAQHIDVYVAAGTGGPLVRWRGVQSVEADWRVTLENTEELGNPHYVETEYDVPEVTGNLVMRPGSVEYLVEKISEVTNTAPGYVVNLLGSQPLEMEIRLRHPDTNDVLKTLRVDDARFDPPPIQARVQQRVDVTFPWESDGGDLQVINGEYS